jgi:S1-C subfamily serine protease
MRKLAPLVLAILLPDGGVPHRSSGQEPVRDVLNAIRDSSVTIAVEARHRGSGTLYQAADGWTYCITALHVIGNNNAVLVCQYRLSPEGKKTELQAHAQVAFKDEKTDLAVLKVGKGLFPKVNTLFHAGRAPPERDSPILHCGSYAGRFHHSIARGHLVNLGESYRDTLVDQADITVYPGSSGGGVFTVQGRFIGFVIAGLPDRVGLFVPLRSFRERLPRW